MIILKRSYGTFGFWTAYLKADDNVILATGTSKIPIFPLAQAKAFLPAWTLLQDPCYNKTKTIIQRIKNCL